MEIKQICRWVVITGTLVIGVIKYFIRPIYFFDGPVRFLLNVAPNLFGSFLIPFAVCWFFTDSNFWVAKLIKTDTTYDVRIICLAGFILLVINEYLQKIPFFGRTFDYYDIWYSAIGLLCSYFIFRRLRKTYQQMAGY